MCLMLNSAGCDENIDPGDKRGEGSLPQELHLHIYQEVFGLADLSLQVHCAREAVQLAGAEVALLVTLSDADNNVVASVSGGRSNPEDLGWDDNVGLKAELVVRDSHRGVLTVQGVDGTAGPLTASENKLENKD